MKNLLVLSAFILSGNRVWGQCEQPTQIPYFENMESTVAAQLPECMFSSYSLFTSNEIFESIDGPVAGYDGKLLAYDTTIDPASGVSPSSGVGAALSTPLMYFQQGMAYTVYFRYGNSNPNLTISSLWVNGAGVEIGSLQNITGGIGANFISAPFTPVSSGNYSITITINSEGDQGLLYIDDIWVQQVGTMGTDENIMPGITLYPNPAKDFLTIESPAAIDDVQVYNTAGQLLISSRPGNSSIRIATESLPKGIYFLNINSGQQIHKAKFLKE